MTTTYTWDSANFAWDSNPYTWNEVVLVEKVAGGGGNVLKNFENLDKDEKKKFIEIIVKVRGNTDLSASQTYKQKKEVKEKVNVTTKDIKLVIKEVLGVNFEISNINV